MQGYCDVFLRIISKRISIEAHVYIWRHQGANFEHFDVSNVIYHKFSHGAVSYTLHEKNVMLESIIFLVPDAKTKSGHSTDKWPTPG